MERLLLEDRLTPLKFTFSHLMTIPDIHSYFKNNLKHKENSGFTLVEIVIAVAIIGILLAVAVPTFLSWLPTMSLKASARELFSNMQKTRMDAIRTNSDWAIVFDPANNSYRICSNPGADGNWATLADNTVRETVDLSTKAGIIAFGHGKALIAAAPGIFPASNVGYTANVIVFTPRGSTTETGFVYLQNKEGATFAVGTQISGVVLLRRWLGGGTWK